MTVSRAVVKINLLWVIHLVGQVCTISWRGYSLVFGWEKNDGEPKGIVPCGPAEIAVSISLAPM